MFTSPGLNLQRRIRNALQIKYNLKNAPNRDVWDIGKSFYETDLRILAIKSAFTNLRLRF